MAAVASRNTAHAVAAARFIGQVEALDYGALARRCGRILIAVPDDAMGEVAGQLAASGNPSHSVLHTSGTWGVDVLAPLARASLDNAVALGPVTALTGPIERGDLSTVARHWAALDAAPPSVRELYRAAGRQALELVRSKGLPSGVALAIEELWSDNQRQNG